MTRIRLAVWGVTAFVMGFIATFSVLRAQEERPQPNQDKIECKGSVKALLDVLKEKEIEITPLTLAQYHFMQGFWVVFPLTPRGMPPGDAAILLKAPRHDDGKVLFIDKSKDTICYLLPIERILMGFLEQVDSGPGEGL